MKIPKELRYTKTHEWVRKQGSAAVVGITDYAQHEISDVVFVELPKVGAEVTQGRGVCVVESVKAAFDIYAPLSGTIKSINTALESDPSLANREPYGNGWFFEFSPANPSEFESLLTAEQYEEFLKQAAH
ncbi:MAG: glycine cleavage system protein GcvH [Candidatus Omnitrophica bacterium]|nr:glycine cleavage system protein GcvH [Candidatus Omnitrophota bacterium]